MSFSRLAFRLTGLVFAAVLAVSVAPQALAQAPMKVGTFDKQRIVDESKLGQDVKTRFEKLTQARESEIEGQRKAYEGLQKAYEQQAPVLSDEKKLERQRELARSRDELQSLMSNADRDLERAYNQAIGELVQKLDPVILDFGKSENYDLLLDQQQYAFAREALDCTDKIIAKVNAMYPVP